MKKALAVGKKEFRQILRDRRTLMILLFIPVFFLLLYGYALNFDIKHVALAVRGPRPERARAARWSPRSSTPATSTWRRRSARDAELAAADGRQRRARGAGHSREHRAGAAPRRIAAPVQVHHQRRQRQHRRDGARLRHDDRPERVGRPASSSSAALEPLAAGDVEPRIWFNPELRSALFLVPGLIGFIGMITAAISTALSVVREKERGTWEQVRMAPIGTVSYVVGKTLPYLGHLARLLDGHRRRGDVAVRPADARVVVVAAAGDYAVPARRARARACWCRRSPTRSWWRSRSALILAFLPTFLLSGFIFPIQNMPQPIQVVTYVVPARYFLVALRGIVLKGVGLATVWRQLVALVVYAVVVLGLASVRLARERG